MSVGAFLKRALERPADAPNRHPSLYLSSWRSLLGGLVGGLLLCTAAVQAAPLSLAEIASDTPASFNATPAPITDGVYFYGSVPQPDTLGAAYMVFAAQNANLVGAMFMPQSSFDCFRGQAEEQHLALQITNSYTQETYGYAIALAVNNEAVAAAGQPSVPLALDGFHDLGTPRQSEMAILATCQGILEPTGVEL